MRKLEILFFFLAVVGALLSQNPVYLESGAYQWLKYLWVFPLGMMAIGHSKLFFSKTHLVLFLVYILFLQYCLFCEMVFNVDYIAADFYNITLSLMICVTSAVFWKVNKSEKTNVVLCWLIIGCGLFLAMNVYSGFLMGSDLKGAYAYASKNSLGSILLCCIIIPLINYRPQRLVLKVVYYLAICFITFVIFLLRSRAVLIGLLFIVVYFLFKSNNAKLRFAIVALIALVVFAVLVNEDFYNILVVSIFLSNDDVSDLDAVSSGRVTIVNDALQLFEENPLFGIGDAYIESMPIAMLVQFGIFGAAIVFFFILYIFFVIVKRDSSIPECKTAFLLYVAFLLNSLFEAQAPFGPGAKSFLMWMMVGLAISYRKDSRFKTDLGARSSGGLSVEC